MNSIEFICLGSGSSGNCYCFRKGNECVLVECGLEPNMILERLLIEQNIMPNEIKAVIITHKHKDHSLAIPFFIDNGIDVYAPESALNEEQIMMPNVKIVTNGSRFKLTNWLLCKPFEVKHDVEAYGYIFLDTETKESTLFINDTKMFTFDYHNYQFDYIFIECNHIRKQVEAMIKSALENGEESKVYKYTRQVNYHLSSNACAKFLSLTDLSKTKAIFLMHLSKEACNDAVVKEFIKDKFKLPIFVCGPTGGIH